MSSLPTCTKLYSDFSFAHRQPAHDGHCALIHGHGWSFEFTFACDRLEEGTGFVIDFGKLQWLKAWLTDRFDHTLVLNQTDPALIHLQNVLSVGGPPASKLPLSRPLARIFPVPDCSSEGLARLVFDEVNRVLKNPEDSHPRGVRVIRVTVFEDSKNSATVEDP